MRKRIADLKDDPDFVEFFQDVQKNGPSAMMKYSNDAAFLKKLNDKLGGEDAIRAAVGGDIPVTAGAPAAAAAPAPPPEVETLHDAARYGDVEAVEDFIAVGKDVNARDSSQRTPLHYAIAFGKGEVGEEIFGLLMDAESARHYPGFTLLTPGGRFHSRITPRHTALHTTRHTHVV